MYANMEKTALAEADRRKAERVMANTERLLKTVNVEKFLLGASLEECRLDTPKPATGTSPGYRVLAANLMCTRALYHKWLCFFFFVPGPTVGPKSSVSRPKHANA